MNSVQIRTEPNHSDQIRSDPNESDPNESDQTRLDPTEPDRREPLVMGIDPSSVVTGFAFMTLKGRPRLVHAGTLKPPVTACVSDRIRYIAQDVERLLATYNPWRTVIEMPSGKVHKTRHTGGGAGLSVYGWVCGTLWQVVRHHYKPLFDVSFGMSHPTELEWCGKTSKQMRAVVAKQTHPLYAESYAGVDNGYNIADAIGLCEWWIAEEQMRLAR